MVQVQTRLGLIDREELEAIDFTSESLDTRVIATEWYLDGELVRRDVWVSLLRGLEASAAVGGMAEHGMTDAGSVISGNGAGGMTDTGSIREAGGSGGE